MHMHTDTQVRRHHTSTPNIYPPTYPCGFQTHHAQAEVRGDVEALRQHVDAYVTQRERRAFELERSAMRAEIEHVRAWVQQLLLLGEGRLGGGGLGEGEGREVGAWGAGEGVAGISR